MFGVTLKKDYKFRSSNKKKHAYNLDFVWNRDYERELLEIYKTETNMATIQNYFIYTYPEREKYFSIDALRSQLKKILREALKKLHLNCIQNSSLLPKQIRLNDERIKCIQRTKSGYQLRLKLIELYLNK